MAPIFIWEPAKDSEAASIMDISFVTQNEDFDYLLDLDNHIIQLAPGEIAVPVYYIQERDLAVGDQVRVNTDTGETVFTIATFSRDSQMNPAIASSKRFLVHEQDVCQPERTRSLKPSIWLNSCWLITAKSAHSPLPIRHRICPRPGPAIDQGLFRLMNTLSDGLVAGVVILMSLLLDRDCHPQLAFYAAGHD